MRPIALVVCLTVACAAPASFAAQDDVSVTVSAGPGVVLQGGSDLTTDAAGRVVFDPHGLVVADTGGSGGGWRLIVAVDGHATIVAADDRGATRLRLPADASTVVLTAATAAL